MPSADPPPPSTTNTNPTSAPAEEEEEEEDDDYLTMTFTDPAPPISSNKSSSARSITALHKSRLLHAETAGRLKSKAEIAREGERKREEGLNRRVWEVDGREADAEGERAKGEAGNESVSKNKGLAMMKKLGWREGMALGATATRYTATDAAAAAGTKDSRSNAKNGGGTDNNGVTNGSSPLDPQPSPPAPSAPLGARLDPLTVSIKDGREGIGLESARKRQLRGEFERHEQERKKRKVEEEGYRERVVREAEERRVEGQCWGAMKVLERLDEEHEEEAEGEGDGSVGKLNGEKKKRGMGTKPLHSIPVLYRGLVKARRKEERDRRMRHDLQTSLPTSLSRLTNTITSTSTATDPDPDLDADDLLALGPNPEVNDDSELDAEDIELQEFETLAPTERLEKLVKELRTRWRYCFWCMCRYGDEEEMEEGCPGEGEEVHG
ncbi:MAG: hypothetical protein Q9160_002540 [Pyrenula sp. 1 TL-2023]